MKTNYPVFEANQVLTNKHLNDAFNYLDDHILQTRHKLIGKGITCGLNIQVSDKMDSITITKGCALTSAGYLIEMEADTTYTAYNTYTLPDNGEQQPDMATYLFNYTFLKNGNAQVPLWQMIPQKVDASDQALNAKFISDKVVLLFLEPKLENLRNCDTTDCNDKGQRMTFTLRPLLVGQRELTLLLQQSGADVRDPLILPQLKKSINPINTARYDVPTTFTLTTSRAINAAFYSLINKNNMISQLHTEINKAYMAWGEDVNANPFLKLDSTLLSKLKSFDTDREKIFIQYYYGYLEDLIRTYHEIRDKGLQLCRYCCQEISNFPLHVVLGLADEDTTRKVQLFRHYFIAAGTNKEQKRLNEEIIFLFERLNQLVNTFNLPQAIFNNQSENDPIYITPSSIGCTPLGDRAIPWYYNLNQESNGLMQYWNYRHFYYDNMDELCGYGISRYNLGGTNRLAVALETDNECKNFFRIEGHVGKHVRTAMSSILQNRNKYRIPFNLVALAARTSDKDLLMDAIFFNDLESQYLMNNNRLKESLTTFRSAINPKTTQLLADLALSDSNRMVAYFNQQMAKPATERDSSDAMTTRVSEMMTAYTNPTLLNTAATTSGTRKLASSNYLTNYTRNINVNILPTLFFDFSSIQYRFSVGQISNHIKTLTGYIDQVTNVLKATAISGFNLDDFNSAYQVFDNYFTNMHTWLKGLTAEEQKQISNYQTLINAFKAYKACCLDDSFGAILEENDRRKQEFRNQFVFNNFIQAHPGIEHKAGVTRGGTFILVYHLNPATTTVPGLSLANNNNLTAATASLSRTAQPATAASAAAATTAGTRKTAATNFAVNNEFINSLSEVQLTQFQTLVSNIDLTAAVAAPADLLLNDYTVIADFYLPYPVNFSGGPITYVLSESDQEPNPTLQISGMVVDAKTGKTIAAANINYNNQVIGTTNADGRFDLVVPEPGTVTFSAKGYAPQDLAVTKPVTDLTIKLDPQSTKVTLAGFVVDSVNQKTLPGTDLSVNQKSVGTTNDKGEFNISVDVGNSVVFTKVGFNTFTHVVTQAEDKLIIPLIPIADKIITRKGRVTTSAQQPLGDVNVLEPKTGRSVLTNSKGEFTIDTLPETSLNFTRAGFSPVSRTCTETEVELFIVMLANTEPPKSIKAAGMVMDGATGAALPETIISSQAANKIIGRSDGNGQFSVETVPFDTLEFVHEGYTNQVQKLSAKDEEFKILMSKGDKSLAANANFNYAISAKFINQQATSPALVVTRANVKDYLGFIVTATAVQAGMSSYNWSSDVATAAAPVQKQTTQLSFFRGPLVAAKGATITLKTTSGSQVLESSQVIELKEIANFLQATLVKKGGLAERQATVMVNEILSSTAPSDATLKVLAKVFA